MVHGVHSNVLLEHGGLPCTLWYLRLLSEPCNSTQTFKTVLDDVLLDHGGLPCVLPFAALLDFEHLPDTQRYYGAY